MRASVHVKLPALTSDGSDAKAKAVCKPLGLSVRGLGGEHTAIGADGTVDISPSGRLMIEEAAIICNLYQGIKNLLDAESSASKTTPVKNRKAAANVANNLRSNPVNAFADLMKQEYIIPAILVGSAALWVFFARSRS